MSQRKPATLGYQPALDGLRALSVVAVIVYHAGFTWFHGGFLGVEVFFVISGFLITTLLIEEHRATGRVSLAGFWRRRARRLLPALLLMLVAVATWTVFAGSVARQAELRRDVPWSVLYGANWGQILHGVPYFSDAQPAMLRHLWSLGVEEQWYLLWPLVFAGLLMRRRRPATFVLAGIVAVWCASWWVQRGGWLPLVGSRTTWDATDRINIDYLSTVTRSGGLLIGALGAFALQFARTRGDTGTRRLTLDAAAALGIAVLLCGCVALSVTDRALYPWLLAVMSFASLVLVWVAVHPRPTRTKAALSWPPLTALGRRSYGLYLWHWPIFVIAGATGARLGRVVPALAAAVLATELSYRFVELPIRTGGLRRWWLRARALRWPPVVATALLGTSLVAFYVQVGPFEAAAGGDAVPFEPILVPPSPSTSVAVTTSTTVSQGSVPAPVPVPGSAPQRRLPAPTPATTEPETSLTLPAEPLTLALVGDSQAYSLAENLPLGIERVFIVTNGAVPGCSVHPSGEGISAQGFHVPFDKCKDWRDQWARAAEGADIALVTLGAWDVLDYGDGATTLVFGTAAFDESFAAGLDEGIAALTEAGAHTALLEVPCMRPPEHPNSFTPQLPERLDDGRVEHLNNLLRAAAARDPEHVTFIDGPAQWCENFRIATDLEYRRDGVHVVRAGAKLVFDTITAQLITIPVG